MGFSKAGDNLTFPLFYCQEPDVPLLTIVYVFPFGHLSELSEAETVKTPLESKSI